MLEWKLGSAIISVTLCWQLSGAIRKEIVCRLSAYPNGRNINWSCPEQRIVYTEKGWYVPQNILPTRVQILGTKAYVLTPKFLSGVPFSLGVISMGGPCKVEPILSPFPSWESQDPTVGGGIVNAVDVFLDRKNILWVLDVGIVETLEEPRNVSTPKVHAICVQTAAVVAVVDLSPHSSPESRFHELQVEVTDEEDTFVYVSDSGNKAIIVWDFSKSTCYKVELPPEVADGGSCKDILYLTLMNTELHFSFMNGRKMYRTSTNNLRCSKMLTEIEEIGKRPGKLVILGSDKKRKMFFRGKGDNQIYLWDTQKPFKPESFVLIDTPGQGMYSTHVSVGFMKLIWALSSNFPDFANGSRSSVGPFAKLHPICSATKCGEEKINASDHCNGGDRRTNGNHHTGNDSNGDCRESTKCTPGCNESDSNGGIDFSIGSTAIFKFHFPVAAATRRTVNAPSLT